MTFRKRPQSIRPRQAVQPEAQGVSDAAASRSAPQGQLDESLWRTAAVNRTPLSVAGRKPIVPANRVVPDAAGSTHQDRAGDTHETGEDRGPAGVDAPSLDERLAWIMAATHPGEFVGRVLDRMHGALMELEDMLVVLEGDDRVKQEYRRALAAQLDHIQYTHLEEWKTELLDGLDADE